MQTSAITVLSRHMDSVYSVTILVLPAVGIVGLVLWILINYQTKKKCTAVTKKQATILTMSMPANRGFAGG